MNIIYPPTENDSALGDKRRPFATLEHAKNIALADLKSRKVNRVTIWLASGEYRIKSPLTISGSELPIQDYNLTFKSLQKQKAIISGWDAVCVNGNHLRTIYG